MNVNNGGSLTNHSTGIITNNAAIAVGLTATLTNNGTYKGSGAFNTSLFTNQSTGYVAPGNSPGCQTFNNGFTTNGSLDIEANGTTACTQYDRINVTGTATLSGTLNFTVGYSPVNGDMITFINATSVSGTFSSVNAPSGWYINYNLPANGNVTMSYGAVITPGAAISLDGVNDYIEVPQNATLNITGNVT